MGQTRDITIQIVSLYYFFLKGKEIKSSKTFKLTAPVEGILIKMKMEHSPPFSATMGVNL